MQLSLGVTLLRGLDDRRSLGRVRHLDHEAAFDEQIQVALARQPAPGAQGPVAEGLLDLLERHGFAEVIANLHYFPETIREHFGEDVAGARQETNVGRNRSQRAAVFNQDGLGIEIDIEVVVKNQLAAIHDVHVAENVKKRRVALSWRPVDIATSRLHENRELT